MANLFQILSITRESMFASQTGVAVTSHNIANADTEGYAKQTPSFQTRCATYSRGGLYLGNGVSVPTIASVQDRFVNYQININQFALGQYEAKTQGDDMLQEILNSVEGSGLSDKMSDFFAAIQTMASHPEGTAERIEVSTSAESLTEYFNRAAKQITTVRESMDQEVRSNVDIVNSLAEELAYLNEKISQIEGTGQSAGDYTSRQTAILQELAEYIDFTIATGDNGSQTIYLAGGMPLVAGNQAMHLEAEDNTADSQMARVIFVDSNGNRTDITDRLTGGKIRGAIEVRDEDALEMLEQLDTLAYEFVTAFNDQHRAGYGLDGQTGIDFFDNVGSSAAGCASRITVSDAILDDLRAIAAGDAAVEGNNVNALALAELETADIIDGSTFSDFTAAIIGKVGSDAASAQETWEHQEAVTQQLVEYRESLVGVSMEEEMANLIQYQESYEAAAKMMSVVDEMLNTLINIL